MAYRDFKDLTRRTTFDKALRDNSSNIAKNLKYDRYRRGMAKMVYNFFDKKASGGAPALVKKSAVKNENILNKELAEKLHKCFS